MKYMRKLSLDVEDNPNAIRGASSNRYLQNKALVLPGDEIFNIIFKGTKGNDINSEGEYIEQDLQQDWEMVSSYFDNALADIATISNDKAKAQIETWFDVLKKVMRIWSLRSEAGVLKNKV